MTDDGVEGRHRKMRMTTTRVDLCHRSCRKKRETRIIVAFGLSLSSKIDPS